MENLIWLLIGLCALIIAAIPAKIAQDRGVAGSMVVWYFAGLLLWPLALIAALATRPDPKLVDAKQLSSGYYKKCPRCAELVKKVALVCRFCQHDFGVKNAPAAHLVAMEPPVRRQPRVQNLR
ncbi:MAG TPA: hypothetical protein VEB61_08865 [Candidatus Binatia bacterium]|nr:hypothetical protein [Candidatus Binatia bacterium]